MPSVKSSSPTQSQGLTKSVTPTKSPGKEASPQKRADKKGKKKKDAEEEDDIIEVTEEGSEEPEAEAEPDEANAPAEAEVAGAEPDGAGAEAGVAGGESDAEVGKSQAEPKGRASPGSASTSWDTDEAPQPALMPTRVDPCIALADVLFCRCLAGPPPKKGFVSPDETRHLEPHLMLGITIDGLRSWLSNNKLHGSRTLVSAVPTGRDAQAAANRESAFDRRSVCERLQSSFFSGWQVGEANVFVSWPLDASITCLVEGLEYYLRAPAARGEPARERATTFFWICTSSLRYHSPEPPPGCVTAESLADISAEHLIYLDECALLMEVFEKTIVLIDRLEEPTMFSRMHCLRELALSQQKHAKLELVLSEAAAEAIDRSLRHDFTPVRTLPRSPRHMHASARHDADTPVLEALGTCMQVLTTTPTPLSSPFRSAGCWTLWVQSTCGPRTAPTLATRGTYATRPSALGTVAARAARPSTRSWLSCSECCLCASGGPSWPKCLRRSERQAR
jgi:hypothetical protein